MISNPASKDNGVVVINLTDSSHGPFSFTLKPGQHPYLYKDSDVNFGDAFFTSLSEITLAVTCGSAKPHQPMGMTIVLEIIKKAKTHPAFTPSLRKYLP